MEGKSIKETLITGAVVHSINLYERKKKNVLKHRSLWSVGNKTQVHCQRPKSIVLQEGQHPGRKRVLKMENSEFL